MKSLKKRILSDLKGNNGSIYKYNAKYTYPADKHKTYFEPHKTVIINWLNNVTSLIYRNCRNVNVYFIIASIIGANITSVSISESGFKGNSSVSINSLRIEDEDAQILIYFVSSILKEIFVELGLKTVLGEVISHYGENDSIINEITKYPKLSKDFIYFSPLEHCIYLINYSI